MSRGDAHSFNPTILREYDIRGVIDDTLSADDAYAIGRAFGTVIVRNGGQAVCVGYDGRLSSPEMEQAVVDGLNDCGIDAIRVGLGPTPMLYFAVNILDAAGGIMVSGSHNPPEYKWVQDDAGIEAVLRRRYPEFGNNSDGGGLCDRRRGARQSPGRTDA